MKRIKRRECSEPQRRFAPSAPGQEFSRSNLICMGLFYLRYPIGETLSPQLNRPPHVELLNLDDPLERRFYEQQTIAAPARQQKKIVRCPELNNLSAEPANAHRVFRLLRYQPPL